MARDYKVCLEDILEAIDRIARYTSGGRLARVRADDQLRDAVLRNLEVIGEAAKNVPKNVQQAHLGVEWKKIAGLRDIVIHEYFNVDDDIIFDVIKNKLPGLKKNIRRILAQPARKKRKQ